MSAQMLNITTYSAERPNFHGEKAEGVHFYEAVTVELAQRERERERKGAEWTHRKMRPDCQNGGSTLSTVVYWTGNRHTHTHTLEPSITPRHTPAKYDTA